MKRAKRNGTLAAVAAALFFSNAVLHGAGLEGPQESFRVSSLVFALNGGVRAGRGDVKYDLVGNGRRVLVSDIDKNCGVLVFDGDKNGKPGKNGRELVGNHADFDGSGQDKYQSGFHALWALVDKAVTEGVLPSSVLERKVLDSEDLARLETAYGLKMKVGSLLGRAVSLKDAGVGAILLSKGVPSMVVSIDDRGDGVSRQPGAFFIRMDGSQAPYEDIWFQARQ